uniref:Uncharacterized protein n=1 Tax=Timema genevievae TaxID=629358 RepID=A0A7R9PGD1_TIMGE|nr:unnamed protein product [Timema genevievae]
MIVQVVYEKRQTPHQQLVKGNLPSPLVSRACEGCIGTLRDYSDGSTLDHVIANATIDYVNYSNIAARLLRKALKPELRADAAKREDSTVRFTPWKDGKSQKHLTTAAAQEKQ